MNPLSHACDIGTYDYSAVDDGEITCKDCGKVWTLDLDKGWKSDPEVTWKPGSPMPRPTYKSYYGKAKAKR